MHITPDQTIFWQYGFFELNATIVTTWIIMLILIVGSWMITRKLSAEIIRSRWENVLEMMVETILQQLKEIGFDLPRKYLSFIGSLFLLLVTANILTIVPGYEPPTGSLSTTVALSLCVFIAVPLYGIRAKGLKAYLRSYTEPTAIMLPFNIIGEISRTMAMAIRLFGNMMSGTMIIAVLLTLAPLVFPIFMILLGLLTGTVQAYIFSILASVYIAAAVKVNKESEKIKNN